MMPHKFVDQHLFHELARRGDQGGVAVERQARVLRASEESRTVRFVLSDGSVDRMGDSIDPNGWQLSDYRRNSTVLWAHDASAPPIGRMVNIFSDGTRLLGDVHFAEPEVYEFADQIFRLVNARYITAGSVGFIPIDFSFADDRDRPFGIDFHEQELLEFSIVPVPANANALIEARAAIKGLSQARSRAAPAPSTMTFAGTLQQRQAALHWQHPGVELDDALAAADSSTREGRRAIVRAHRRFGER
jgi:HK97 family phage prohead protease